MFLRRVRARVDDRPTGFVWVEEGALSASGYPASRGQVAWLAKAGVRSLLTLTESPLPAGWFSGLEINSRHIPMQDHEAPSLEVLEEAARYVEEERSNGRAVAVHCLAGEGRTGCVLAAYLIGAEGLGAREALGRIRSLKPEFVEKGQEKAIYEFAERAKSRPGHPATPSGTRRHMK